MGSSQFPLRVDPSLLLILHTSILKRDTTTGQPHGCRLHRFVTVCRASGIISATPGAPVMQAWYLPSVSDFPVTTKFALRIWLWTTAASCHYSWPISTHNPAVHVVASFFAYVLSALQVCSQATRSFSFSVPTISHFQQCMSNCRCMNVGRSREFPELSRHKANLRNLNPN